MYIKHIAAINQKEKQMNNYLVTITCTDGSTVEKDFYVKTRSQAISKMKSWAKDEIGDSDLIGAKYSAKIDNTPCTGSKYL